MGWGTGRLPQHSIIPPFHRNPSRRLYACARLFPEHSGHAGPVKGKRPKEKGKTPGPFLLPFPLCLSFRVRSRIDVRTAGDDSPFP